MVTNGMKQVAMMATLLQMNIKYESGGESSSCVEYNQENLDLYVRHAFSIFGERECGVPKDRITRVELRKRAGSRWELLAL